jgi:hypothetical protein
VDELVDENGVFLVGEPLSQRGGDLAAVDVVVARDEEQMVPRHLGRERPAHGVEEGCGLSELLFDRLPRPLAQVAEGGVAGEEDQVRPQTVLPLEVGEIRDQDLPHPIRVPA